MIQLYFLDCSPLLDQNQLQRSLPLLDEARREKVDRLRMDEKKAQSAAAGLLLRKLFGDVTYAYGHNGKPYIANDQDRYFSISHSGRYVVCAVADTEVGVDVEVLSSPRPAVIRRCFTPEEQDWIDNDSDRFIRLWTMKEAYMKLTGSGLSIPAKDVHLPIPPVNGFDNANNCWWHLSRWESPVSLCCHQEDIVKEHIISIKDLL